MATTLLLGLLASLPSPAASAPEPVVLGLVPVSDEALHGCKAPDLQKALSKALGRSKRLSYRPGSEGAPLRLEILACTRVEDKTQTRTTRREPVKGPTEHGVAEGTDTEIGLQNRTFTSVILKGRLVAAGRFMAVESLPSSRSLDEAAGSLRHAIDEALVKHGDWLVAPGP